MPTAEALRTTWLVDEKLMNGIPSAVKSRSVATEINTFCPECDASNTVVEILSSNLVSGSQPKEPRRGDWHAHRQMGCQSCIAQDVLVLEQGLVWDTGGQPSLGQLRRRQAESQSVARGGGNNDTSATQNTATETTSQGLATLRLGMLVGAVPGPSGKSLKKAPTAATMTVGQGMQHAEDELTDREGDLCQGVWQSTMLGCGPPRRSRSARHCVDMLGTLSCTVRRRRL